MYFELLKLALATGVPAAFLITGRHRRVLLWVGAVIGIELLDVNIVASVSPVQVVGLLCVPYVVGRLPEVLVSRAARLVVMGYFLLAFAGCVYGYLYPWPDLTAARPWNQLPQGRSVIFLVRHLSELALALYVAHIVRAPGRVDYLLRCLVVGTTIVAVGVLLEAVLGADIFHVLAPSSRSLDIGRARGFTAEPRTAGQYAAIGLLLVVSVGRIRRRRLLSFVHAAAVALTLSTAGISVLAIGLVVLLVQRSSSARVTRTVLLLFVLSLVAYLLFAAELTTWASRLGVLTESRLTPDYPWDQAQHAGDWLANHLEPFDGAAVLFLWENPQYLVFGTGPGLISLPASEYVPYVHRAVWGYRIDSVPHMGLFLVLANNGLVGLSVWALVFLSCWRGLRWVSDTSADRAWRDATALFLAMAVVYMLQAQVVWYVFLGIGLAATVLEREAQLLRRRIRGRTLMTAETRGT